MFLNHFKKIHLPNFSSKDMSSKRSRLNKKTKCEMLRLGHYRFRVRIMDKLKDKVIICTEEYTSKTCTKGGTIDDKLGGAEVFKCKNSNCNLRINRDINGVRNILLKNHIV